MHDNDQAREFFHLVSLSRRSEHTNFEPDASENFRLEVADPPLVVFVLLYRFRILSLSSVERMIALYETSVPQG